MRLLKFDTINPHQYLIQKQTEWGKENIHSLSRTDYLNQVLDLKANFSDFYTYYLRELGWEAEEFLLGDEIYTDKVAKEMTSFPLSTDKMIENIKNKIKFVHKRRDKKYIRAYIKSYKPDVILVRESSQIESSFWKEFAQNSLLVSRIAMKVPTYWNLYDWDLIYTSTQAYKTFFELQGKQTIINSNGFDERILDKVNHYKKQYDISFVGGVGGSIFSERTEMLNEVSKKFQLLWWGYGREKLKTEVDLLKNWQGITAGLEMFSIYKKSKILLNEYGSIAENEGVNQRIFEVLGVGTFLLTRKAKNLENLFPKDLLITFETIPDCIDKINYFLKNEKEREEIAQELQKNILEKYSYQKLMIDIEEQLKNAYNKKYGIS